MIRRITWIGAISLLLTALGGEIAIRLIGNVPQGLDRILHPYLVIGGFHRGGYFPPSADPTEIPEAFGYHRAGLLGMYYFDYKQPVQSITERGRFLYRDRAELAETTPVKNELRFYIQGGSVAFGEGASSPAQRWFIVLENLLTESMRRPVHSIPAANHSHVTTQERIIQDLYVLPKHPNAVIYLTGFNDANTAISATRPGDPYGQGLIYLRDKSPFFEFLSDLSKHSDLLRYLMLHDTTGAWGRGWPPEESSQALVKSVASVFLDNIGHMKRRCDQEKIPCFFFLQPEWDLTLRRRGIKPASDFDFILACYREILQQREQKAPFLHDLTGVFDDPKKEVPFFDPAHFNDAGHVTIAQAIAKTILESHAHFNK